MSAAILPYGTVELSAGKPLPASPRKLEARRKWAEGLLARPAGRVLASGLWRTWQVVEPSFSTSVRPRCGGSAVPSVPSRRLRGAHLSSAPVPRKLAPASAPLRASRGLAARSLCQACAPALLAGAPGEAEGPREPRPSLLPHLFTPREKVVLTGSARRPFKSGCREISSTKLEILFLKFQ